MHAVVVYESMYGNTHLVASAVGDGLRPFADVTVVPVGEADASLLAGADLLVVGGPTHARRHEPREHAEGRGRGRREGRPTSWSTPTPKARACATGSCRSARSATHAAAFDTRMHVPAAFSGRASKGIARKLHQHGATLVAVPESFFVTKENHLEPHEEEHARAWGAEVGTAVRP